MKALFQWPARRAATLVAGGVALWWLGVTFGVPVAIRAAHAGRLPLPGHLMSGRDRVPVEDYLARWEEIARSSVVIVMTTALVAVAAFWVIRYGRRRAAAEVAVPPPASAGLLLLTAGWSGLVVGSAEAYYLMLRAFYRHALVPNLMSVSPHAVWMAPLADAVLFLGAGALLLGLRRAYPEKVEQRAVVGGLVWLGVFGVVMATDRLHWAATGALALGVAVQVHGVLSPGASEVARLARRSLPGLLAMIACLGSGVRFLEWQRERRQLTLAGAPAPDASNVLFIVLDTERAASTSLYGGERPTTPFLQQFAPEGATFALAIAPASWTLPSHAAMFTGREAVDLGVDWDKPLGDAFPTLAEVLSNAGYATAGFVANHWFGSDFFGLDRGFGRWEDQPILPGTVIRHSWLARSLVLSVRHGLGNRQELGRKTADHVNADFLRWVDRPRRRPFFAFLNYIDAHSPYLPPEPWNLRFAKTQPLYWVDEGRKPEDFTDAELAELRAAYDGSIAYLDDRLGRLIDALRQRKLLDSTLVIITSDHGEALGEGHRFDHGQDLTITRLHVPLVMVLPGRIPPGTRVDAPVDMRHLAATVLDLADAGHGGVAGESLARYWTSTTGRAGDGMVVTDDGSRTSVVTDAWHYLREHSGEERLYDFRRDYGEEHDLAEAPLFAAARDSLRAVVTAWRAARRPGR